MKTSIVKKLSRTALAAALACALPALAGPDNAGLGSAKQSRDGVTLNNSSNPINRYAAVDGALSAQAMTLTLASTQGFENVAKGALVMVLQTTEGTSDTESLDSGIQAGHWEFARIESMVGPKLMLQEPLEHAYADNATQVILVPEYDSVTVAKNTILSPEPWNESTGTGGVLAFLVNGKLTLQPGASINAKGKGFHGGTTNKPCSKELVTSDEQRGQGLSGGAPGMGQSAPRFATNSEVCEMGGGGGGGNGGDGGIGGTSSATESSAKNLLGGKGGAKLDYAPTKAAVFGDRLLMGSGGGAGNGSLEPGGAGGGIIFIRAEELDASLGRIDADGEGDKGKTSDESGSGSGGGAGGTVYLRISKLANCKTVSVKGGVGGDAEAGMGPGGGGAGGWVFIQKESGTCQPANIALDGGGPGKDQGGAQHNATKGQPGVVANLNDTLQTGFPVLLKPVVETPANGLRTEETSQLYTGSMDVKALKLDQLTGTRVDVYVDGERLGDTEISADGRWSLPRSSSHRDLPLGEHTVVAVAINKGQGVQSLKSEKTTFTVVAPPEPPPPHRPARDLVGGGVGCAASGGTPSALAMMGLAVLSSLLARRRRQ